MKLYQNTPLLTGNKEQTNKLEVVQRTILCEKGLLVVTNSDVSNLLYCYLFKPMGTCGDLDL